MCASHKFISEVCRRNIIKKSVFNYDSESQSVVRGPLEVRGKFQGVREFFSCERIDIAVSNFCSRQNLIQNSNFLIKSDIKFKRNFKLKISQFSRIRPKFNDFCSRKFQCKNENFLRKSTFLQINFSFELGDPRWKKIASRVHLLELIGKHWTMYFVSFATFFKRIDRIQNKFTLSQSL